MIVTHTADARDADSREAWLTRMDEIGEDSGYFQPLGTDHWAFFVDEAPTLLVTFETLDGIRTGDESRMPLGHRVAAAQDWSHLCLIADGPTWYRDPAVYGYFDRLVDDAFFEDFDRVVFFGAGMGGYAAAAFSVAAPGATVLLCAPQATLEPRLAGWDPRFRDHRRLCFTDRYGYAPDMTEGAGQVFVLFDPWSSLDAAHAAQFNRPFSTLVRLPGFGTDPLRVLDETDTLEPLLTEAGEGRLNAHAIHSAARARHEHLPWLRGLLGRTDQRKRPDLSARVCRAVLRQHNAPRFRKRLAEIEGAAG